MGGEEVSQARGQKGSRGGRTTLNCGSSLVIMVGTFPRARGGVADISMMIAYIFQAGRPHDGRLDGHLALLASTSTKAPKPFPYKRHHNLQGENHITVEV
jgi:hypothetical protein